MGFALIRTALFGAALLGVFADTALACPSCKSASSEPLEWAIVLMIAGVFTIGGCVVFLIVKVARQFDAQHDELDANV